MRNLLQTLQSFRDRSFWWISAVIVSIACTVAFSVPPTDFGGGSLIASLDSRWEGRFERSPIGISIPGGQVSSVIRIKVKLKQHTQYRFKITAIHSPTFHVDFYGPGYDFEEQEFVVPPTISWKNRTFEARINSGNSPDECDLRIHFLSDKPVTLSNFEVWEISGLFFMMRKALIGFFFLNVLLALFFQKNRSLLLGFLIFCIIFLIYIKFAKYPAHYQFSDNRWYIPTALSLLKEGDIDLSEYQKRVDMFKDYRILQSPRVGQVNYYPMC